MKKDQNIFNKLFENPLIFIASAYPYLLAVIIGLGLIYITNLNSVYVNKVAPYIPDSTLVKTTLEIKDPSVADPVPPSLLGNPSDEDIEAGRTAYANQCASCHGDNGRGDGSAGAGLNPAPRNFHDLEGWVNGPKVSQMYETLQNGIAGSGMTAYDFLSPEERLQIIHFTRAEFMENAPEDTEDELKAMDEFYSLSEGRAVPGQVTVAGAMKILETESAANVTFVKELLADIRAQRETDAAAGMFCSVTSNPQKALTTLLNSGGWMDGLEGFTRVIDQSIIDNGFTAEVYRLSNDEFNSLHAYLKGMYAGRNMEETTLSVM